VSGDAATATATIKGTLLLPDDTPVNMTRLSLNAGEQLTYSRLDGTFAFYNVPPGVHLVDVHSHTLMFSQIKIQLLEDSMDSPNCIEYTYPGANKQPIAHPLVLRAHATYEYFEHRPGFSVVSLLRNPMLLMMLFTVGMMYLMPKMMDNLEPEEKEKMRAQMEMQKDPTKMLSQLFGMGEEEPAKPARRNKRD
jgi:ER membrane protein complex subunit 7